MHEEYVVLGSNLPPDIQILGDCTIKPLFDVSLCDLSQLCEAPKTSSSDYKCPEGFEIE